MKRNELVQRLIKEGMSEKTLVNFSDIQIRNLAERMLGEAVTKMTKVYSMSNQKDASDVNNLLSDPVQLQAALKSGHIQVTKEEQKPTEKQLKSLDKNKNKKIDKEDFKLLRKGKKISPLKKENVEVRNWVSGLIETNYHSFTSKGEIMELVQSKMSNSISHGPNVKKGHNDVPEFMSYDAISKSEVKEDGTTTKPKTKPTTKPSTPKPKTPYNPGPGKNPKPKALKEDK